MIRRRPSLNLVEFRITEYGQFRVPTPEKIRQAKPTAFGRIVTAVGVYKAIRQMGLRIAALIDDTAIDLVDSKLANLEQVANVVGVKPEVMLARMDRRRAERKAARDALAQASAGREDSTPVRQAA